MEGIGFNGDSTLGSELCRTAQQHLVGEVGGQYWLGILWPASQQRQRHIPGSTAKIQNLCVRLGQHLAKTACRPAPPDTVDVAGQDMVQQVVAGGDLVEHGADRCLRADLVSGSFWLSARRGHGYLLPAESWRIDSIAATTSASVTSSATTASPRP